MKKLLKRLAAIAMLLALTVSLVPFSALADGVTYFSNLVVCVRFSDDTATDAFNYSYTTVGGWTYNNWDLIKKMYNGNGSASAADTSFRHYMSVISDGRFSVINYMPQQSSDGATVNVLTLSRPLSHYSTDTAIVTEVISAIDSGLIQTNFSLNRPDYRSAGVIDNLTIIVQGASPSDRGSPIYAHKSDYSDPTKTAKGYSVGSFNIFTASLLVKMPGSDALPTDKQGVIAHEFIHSLGIGDLYRYSGNGNPVGAWDIMASSGYKLQLPLGYTRYSLGFIEMTEATGSGRYTLDMAQKEGGNRLLKLKSPLSENEFFCLEYRVKDSNTDPAKMGFDAAIPATGLVAYRINSAVTSRSNAAGEDYMYVFRKGAASPTGAAETLADSAFGLSNSLTSYGSGDLAASYTQNTLFYSDGSNSGISVDNISLSADGSSISFDLSFADYSSLSLWSSATLPFSAEDGSDVTLAADGDRLYMAYTDGGSVAVKCFDGSSFSNVGDPVSGLTMPSLAVASGVVYVGGMDSRGYPACYRLSENRWVNADSVSAYCSNGYTLFVCGGRVYGCYIEASSPNLLRLRSIDDRTYLGGSISGRALTSPAIAVSGGDIYLTTADAFASGSEKNTALYRLAAGSTEFEKLGSLPFSSSGDSLTASGGGIYGLCGYPGTALTGFSYVDGILSTRTLAAAGTASFGQLISCGGRQLVTYNNSGELAVYEDTDGGLVKIGASLTKVCYDYSSAAVGNRLYVACSATGGGLLLKYRDMAGSTPEPDRSHDITLTPPDGYAEAAVYVDGVCFAAEKSGASFTVKNLPEAAKTATMYKYTPSGVPVGMYVWLLNFENGAFTVTALPQMTDLLSYHGFSIRVVAPAGIRIKSGISAATRAALTSKGGLDGYSLTEYGTVAMNYANISSYPMVKGGAGTKSGAAYWYSGSTLNDKIFEEVGGRYRFTSVLIGIPETAYKTQFAFRGYIILKTPGGESLTLYGPIVHRSIYEIAKSVDAGGEFKNSPKADAFVKAIIKISEQG